MFFFHSMNEAHCDNKSFETESSSVTDKLCLFSFCFLFYQFDSFLFYSCSVKKTPIHVFIFVISFPEMLMHVLVKLSCGLLVRLLKVKLIQYLPYRKAMKTWVILFKVCSTFDVTKHRITMWKSIRFDHIFFQRKKQTAFSTNVFASWMLR